MLFYRMVNLPTYYDYYWYTYISDNPKLRAGLSGDLSTRYWNIKMIYDFCVRGVGTTTDSYYYAGHDNIIIYKQSNVFSMHVWTLYANSVYYTNARHIYFNITF